MARLCSFERDYKQAIIEVRDIYLTRGDPAGMLKSWIKNNYKHRWQSPILLEKSVGDEQEHLWLKSEYNPIWQSIDIPRILGTMDDALKRNFPNINDDSRLWTTLKRNRNFAD
jgi:hypothetical protein